MIHPKRISLIQTFGEEKGEKLYEVLHTANAWEKYASAQAYRLQCYNEPPIADLKLYACDEILETCGIEGIAYDHDLRYGLSFCNAGDSYNTTLTYCSEDH